MNNRITMSVGPTILERMSNERSSDIYMISEFIDNSIQSMVDHKDVIKKIKIDIDLNYKARKLTITDNAYGIEPDRYEKVISLYGDVKESGLSRFGVGLKSAAFWYGRQLTILSKCPNQMGRKVVISIDEMNAKVKKNLPVEEVWSFEPVDEPLLTETGTKIIIDEMYDKRKKQPNEIAPFDDSKKMSGVFLSEMISDRYKRFLENKTLEINLICSYAATSETKIYKIDHTKIRKLYVTKDQYCNAGKKIFYLDPLVESDWTKLGEKSKSIYTNIQNKIKTILNSPEVYVDNEKTISAKKILEDILAKKDMWWEFNWNFNEQLSIPIKFGFINPSQTINLRKYNGFAVFQNMRAIIGGPNVFGSYSELSSNNKWATDDMIKTSGSINRVFGEISLDDEKQFPVDKNKAIFDGVDSKAFIEKLMEDLGGVKINELSWIVSQILNTQIPMENYGAGNTSQSEQFKKAADIVFNKNIEINTVDLPGVDYVGEKISYVSVFFEGKNYKITPIMRSDMESNRFVNVDYDENDDLIIYINSNHGIWKGLFPDEKIKSDLAVLAIHTISIVIALAYIYSPSEYDDTLSSQDRFIELINCAFNGKIEN